MYCPYCKTYNLTKAGKRWHTINSERIKIQQFLCNVCGKYTTKPLDKVKDKEGRIIILENKVQEKYHD
jgi:transposase-like protein